MTFDIVPERRIVFACDIRVDGRVLSVSLVTVEFSATRGTEEGLDRLGLHLHPRGAGD